MWDDFLTSQEELNEDLIKKNDEFENKLKEIIENNKFKLGKYDEKTKNMLENWLNQIKRIF